MVVGIAVVETGINRSNGDSDIDMVCNYDYDFDLSTYGGLLLCHKQRCYRGGSTTHH